MNTLKLFVLASVLLVASGCKNEPPAPATHVPTPAAADDHIVVLAKHTPSKPTDPVTVRFDRFKVVHASFDPKTIEGGRATIELDLASLRTGSSERDDDLKSPTYIDVGKFATATIEIANVKKKADKTFTADATVQLRGTTKSYPVTFDVIQQNDDSIQIKGEHTFSRLDFSVGTDPAKDSQQQVDTELTIQMVLTLRNG
jgi:polyisoprenoid-binding protein YceI